MADGGLWARLSLSSQQAMRWAAAHARVRRGPYADVDAFDLLAGLLVAHGRDSEPWQLARHFGFAIGAVLDGPHPNSAELRAAFERDDESMPLMDPAVDAILAHGVAELTRFDADGLLTFRALFGALLATPNPASDAIRRALDERGAPSAAVIDAYVEYLSGLDNDKTNVG